MLRSKRRGIPEYTFLVLLLLSSIGLYINMLLVFDSMLAHLGMSSNIPDRLLDSWYVSKLVLNFEKYHLSKSNLTLLEFK